MIRHPDSGMSWFYYTGVSLVGQGVHLAVEYFDFYPFC